MIRNIPTNYNADLLMKELEDFNGKYDCVYLPYDYERNGTKGFAFINFINPLHNILFYEHFEGKTWKFIKCNKICSLNMANYQGINEIKKHANNYKSENKPIFIENKTHAEVELPMVNNILTQKYLIFFRSIYPLSMIEESKHGFKILTL
jgi:hypothetical protein